MMKAVVFLAAILTASAVDQEDHAKCALDGAKAASEMSDVIVYLWAAQQRCAPQPTGHQMSPKCAIDITAALKAVNDMVTIIVEAVEDCAEVKIRDWKCGEAVSELTGGSMALAKASANTLHHCPKSAGGLFDTPKSSNPTPQGIDNGGYTTVGKCMVNVKAATGSLFKATEEAAKIRDDCDDNDDDPEDAVECGRTALQLGAAIGSVGSALGMGIFHCEAASGLTANKGAACAGAIAGAVAAITRVTDAGLKIAEECTPDDDRLYALEKKEKKLKSKFMNNSTAMVAMTVPIFAVLSFVAGSRFRSWQMQQPSARTGGAFLEAEATEITELSSGI